METAHAAGDTRQAFLERLANVIYELWVIETQAEDAINAEAYMPGYTAETEALVLARDNRREFHERATSTASACEVIEATRLADTWKARWAERSKPRKLHAKFRRQAEALRARTVSASA